MAKYKKTKCTVTKRFVTNKGTHEVGSIYYPTNEKLLENLINTKRIEKCQ